jgi:phospholipid/cholesterol/gamma-HCH transport system substrate-binding protein
MLRYAHMWKAKRMKINADNKARLGFAIVLFVGAVAGILWYLLSSSQYTAYQIETRDPVSGLIADAPVDFHGVEVGRVKSVELIDPHAVSIMLRVKKGAPVTTATVATITSRGLAAKGFTGYVYISLEDVGTDPRQLVAPPGKKYPVIPATSSKSVNLDTAVSQVNDNVQFMTRLLQSVLDEKTVVSLKQSLDSLQRVTEALADNTEKLNSLVANTERASRELKPLVESSSDTVKALQTQILPEAHKALSNLDNLSSTLSAVAARINRDPSVLVRGAAPPPPGPGERR